MTGRLLEEILIVGLEKDHLQTQRERQLIQKDHRRIRTEHRQVLKNRRQIQNVHLQVQIKHRPHQAEEAVQSLTLLIIQKTPTLRLHQLRPSHRRLQPPLQQQPNLQQQQHQPQP